MSRDASPVQSAHPHQPFDAHHDQDSFDLFADVSHHGSSLFELFAHPNFDTLSPRSANPLLYQGAQESFRSPATDISLDIPVSRDRHQVDSYCTVDPDLSPVPVEHAVSPVPPISAETLKAPVPSKSNPRKPVRKPSKPKKNVRPAGKVATGPRQDAASRPSPKLPPGRTITKSRPTPPAAHDGSPNTARRKRPPLQDKLDVDSDSDGMEVATGSSKHPSQAPGAVSQDTGSIGESLNKDTHNSHTRRCRAKVKSKFEELLSILPTPPPRTGIKHKAQILDYTIRVYRDIHARKTLLEAELALSSRQQLNSWVDSVVSRSASLHDALVPYLSLICTKGGWKYSEAWVPMHEPMRNDMNGRDMVGGMHGMSGDSRMVASTMLAVGPNARLRLGPAVIPSLGNTDDPDLQSKLERFRDRSRPYGFKLRCDLPGRILCTMRPEWLPSLQDEEAFQRAKLAREASLVVCFGVPVFVRGHVAAVAVFFDTEQRAYDAKNVDLADSVASLLGNSFGAHASKRRPIR